MERKKSKGLEMYFGHEIKQKWVMGWMWETSKEKAALNLDQGGSRREEKKVGSGDILKAEPLRSADG